MVYCIIVCLVRCGFVEVFIVLWNCCLKDVILCHSFVFFFFQAEDGIRDLTVTGVHVCSSDLCVQFRVHASENSELHALLSSDSKKLKELSKKYDVPSTYSYEEYDQCLESGEIDAVYIALPNNMHREYTERAARAGVHVLCEKPMAITEHDCESMIETAQKNHVKLMIAYRLHFEEANLSAIEIVKSGKLGKPRIFN